MIENELINQAIEYIFDHIEEKITVDDVAEHCHISKYHFSRIFKEEVGQSLYSFIKENRIALSAVSLKVRKDRSITDVGLDCGYSASNYATAFKEQLSISPVRFRQDRSWNDGRVPHPFFDVNFGVMKSYEEYDNGVVIKELPDMMVHYRRFIGSYVELKEHWIKFMDDFKEMVTKDTCWIERSFSDPDIVQGEKCICDICITVEKDSKLSPKSVIPGGKYAVYSFKGHKRDIYTEYQGILTVWLPRSAYSLCCGELFDIIKVFDNKNEYVEMEICIPIEQDSTNSEV